MKTARTGSQHRTVIVGAGLAGLSAAERLRERGYDGQIMMIGEEAHRPYNRTPLSKQLLTGRAAPADLRLRSYTDVEACWRLGTRATGLDLDRREIHLPGGERLGFDNLVIASGVEARHLPGSPMHSDHVWMLRTVEDARNIDQAMSKARHVAVVGGGFIGAEIACTARARGLKVTIIDVSPTLLNRALGPALGAVIGDLHRKHGVRLHLGVGVAGWQENRRGVTITLEDGETIPADLAVVGIGTLPRTEWLRGNGLDLSDGVRCTATTHVADATGAPIEGIVAAGDVAAWPNLRFDPQPRRVEHWINAIEMGQHAAEALLAGAAPARHFTPIPRFWSHQHGLRIQSVGMPGLGSSVQILHGDPVKRRTVAGFVGPGTAGPDTLLGVVALDSPRRVMSYADRIGQPLDGLRAGKPPRPGAPAADVLTQPHREASPTPVTDQILHDPLAR